VGIAVLEGTRGFIVGGVTIHDQNPGQGFLSEDQVRDLGRTAFPEQEQTDLLCGKEPDVPILTFRSPTGFIGVFGWGKAVLFDQVWDHGTEQVGQTMKAFHEGSRVDLELLADPTEGDPVQIVHDGGRGEQLIAVEILRQDSRGRGLKGLSAMGTILSGEPIQEGLGLQRLTLQYQPVPQAFIDKNSPTARATIPDPIHHLALLHPRRIRSLTPCASMSGASPFGFSFFGLRGIGFERKLCRGSGRAEETLLFLSQSIGKLLSKTLNFLREFVDLSLFLEAFRTGANQDLSSLNRTICFWRSEISRVSPLSFR